MKANGTRILVFALFVQLLLLVFSFSVSAQRPDYDFSNGTLTSGQNRRVNSTYRYNNVKTGVDAIVRITALTGGVTLNEVDGNGSGFREAFQPVIQVPGHSSGYAEFNINWLQLYLIGFAHIEYCFYYYLIVMLPYLRRTTA